MKEGLESAEDKEPLPPPLVINIDSFQNAETYNVDKNCSKHCTSYCATVFRIFV
jgi:hypothetical protein